MDTDMIKEGKTRVGVKQQTADAMVPPPPPPAQRRIFNTVTQERVDLAREMWELGWEPLFTTVYHNDFDREYGFGILNAGYGKFTDGEYQYPLYPAHRYLPDNQCRNLKKMDNGFTLKPCPFCGHQPDEDNLIDSIHPVTRDYSIWQAGCVDNEGGCNAYVLGGTMLEAVNNWNKRVGE